MTRAAATVVFEPTAAAVQVDDRFAACLRTVATDAAALPVRRERVRAGAALAFAVEYAATLGRASRPVRRDGFFAARAGRPPGRRRGRRGRGRRGPPLGRRAARPAPGLPAGRGRPLPRRGRRAGAARAPAHRGSGLAPLALLAGVGRRDRVPLPMSPLEDDPRAWSGWGAREDVADLQRAGLLDPPPAPPRPVATLPRLRAADLRLTRRGVLLHRLLVARPAARGRRHRGAGRPGTSAELIVEHPASSVCAGQQLRCCVLP